MALVLARWVFKLGPRRRGQPAASGSLRSFSATAKKDLENQTGSSAQAIETLAGERPNPNYTTTNPMEKLKKILQGPLPAHSRSDDYETAWQLYLHLTPEQRTQRTFVNLINYLSFSTRSEDYIRSSWLLDQAPFLKSQDHVDRSANQYWGALVQQLRMGNAQGAVEVHDNAMRSKAKGYIGTNLLLAQLLQAKEWKYAIAVYSSKMATIVDADKDWLRDDRAELWDFVDRLPNLLSLTCSLFGKETLGPRSGGRYIQDFVEKLVIKAVVQCLQSKPGPTDCKLVRDLISQLGPKLPGLYDVIMKQVVKVLRSLHLQSRNYLDLSQLLADVLDLSKATNHYHTNPGLVFDIAVIMAKSAPLAAKSRWWGFSHSLFAKKFLEIREENRALTGHAPAALHRVAMQMYAKLGNVAEVLGLFDKLSKDSMREEIALPVLELFATKAEPKHARNFFERLREEFKWQPTTRCWNALLRILARADDMTQGLNYFKEMLKSGPSLDAYSYLPILQLYSRRGLVKEIEELLGKAQSNGVVTDTKMFYYLVIANLEIGDVFAAEQAAKAVIEARKCYHITGPTTLIWNAVLEAYGRQRDWTNVMKIYKSMVDENVAPNTQTYTALLEALCKQHKAGEAWQLLQGLQRQDRRDVIPAHYREVMLGFISQRQPRRALNVYDKMCEAGIKPDASVIVIQTRAKTLYEAHDAAPTEGDRQIVDAKLSNIWDKVTELAETDPGKGTSEILGGAKEALAATMIMNYGSANQADVVAKWFDRYVESQEAREENNLPPMTILRAFMTSFLHAGDDAELERCWKQYLHQAEIFATKVSNGESRDSQFEAHTRTLPLYPSRRHIVSGPLVLYMKSLSLQGRRAKIKATVLALLDRGWKLDNIAWNEYVRCLIAHASPGDFSTNEPDAPYKNFDPEDGIAIEDDRRSSEDAVDEKCHTSETNGAGFGDFPMDLQSDEMGAIMVDNLDRKNETEGTQSLVAPKKTYVIIRKEVIQTDGAADNESEARDDSRKEVAPLLTVDAKKLRNEAVSLSVGRPLEGIEPNEAAFEHDSMTVPPELNLVSGQIPNVHSAGQTAASEMNPLLVSIKPALLNTSHKDDNAALENNELQSPIDTDFVGTSAHSAINEEDASSLVQDDPSPSDILTAFRVCEQRLMPNFPGWVDKARPLHASERRGKYAGGLYWMKTEKIGRRLYQGLLVPQFETLSALRDIINQLERKAYAEEFDKEQVGMFSEEGASIIATAENKPWDDAAWALGTEAKAREEAKRKERTEAKAKMQQEQESRKHLSRMILEQGEVPLEVGKRDIHVPADVILNAVKTWAPLTVDAAMLIPVVLKPEGFGQIKEMTIKKAWMWKTIKRWTRQLKSNQTRIEKLRNLSQAFDAAGAAEEKKEEIRERLNFFENELKGLEEGAITKIFENGKTKAWLKKISDREKFALRQSILRRRNADDEYYIEYPTDRKGKALFIFGDGEPPASEGDAWLEKFDEAEEQRKADEIRQRELDKEFKRQAEEERRMLEGRATFDDPDRATERMKGSKSKRAKLTKKKEKAENEEASGGESDVVHALSALEKEAR
ncbi:hypothetical protein FKW77_000197 [Venturia effusa]|uniref:Uncharacterized protein n=1 Tax=Venturia effusa TaxID=50376 RepID=A0A517L8C6_9PEZI|nr:hypothetical protein FKW77_000197 [Venturia effusa]